MRTSLFCLFTALLTIGGVPYVASAYTAENPPPGFAIQTIVGDLDLPTTFVFAPDQSMFIALKKGVVLYAKDGIVRENPVIALPKVNDYGDRGLLSIALDPGFPTKRYLYLLYTYENDPTNYSGPKTGQLLRVTLDANDVAIPGTERILLGKTVGNATNPSCENFAAGADCIASDSSTHGVADLEFAPDGKLFVSIGDGANFDRVDPLAHRAQDLGRLNGKILRINPATGAGYADNPYYKTSLKNNRSKVWTLGLRNPFRMSIRASNGTLYVGDVGSDEFEEVNVAAKGKNFGWPCREGNAPTPGYPAVGKTCKTSGYTDPIHMYTHEGGMGGSITGGLFYPGDLYAEAYHGAYFYGDYSQDFIKMLRVDDEDHLLSSEDFIDSAGGPVAFTSDDSGNIYYVSIYFGEIRKIAYVGGENRAPLAKASANTNAGQAPLSVQFTGSESSDPDGDLLSYLWNFGDGTTSTEPNPSHTYQEDMDIVATLTVTDPFGMNASESVRITIGNDAPTFVITSPENESVYSPGQTITLRATGFDQEDGVLPESAYAWKVILHHNVHTHILESLGGSAPSFVGPDHGTDPDIYLEVELTVTDSAGIARTKSISLRLAGSVAACAANVSHTTLYSGTSTQTSSGANAVPTYTDVGWSALLPGATWIWNAFHVATPATGEEETFTRTFSLSGTPTGAHIIIAADDHYEASLNGTEFIHVDHLDNFSSGKQDAYDISALLQPGENTLSVTVHNIPTGDTDPEVNPAGLLYMLDASTNSCPA